MKKSLLLIILFLLYQVLAAVMAQVWTHLNGSGAGAEAADVAAMPSATSLGVSMLVSMAPRLVFALRVASHPPMPVAQQSRRRTADDGDPGDTTLAATLCPPKKWQAKIVKGRPVSAVGWGMALVGFCGSLPWHQFDASPSGWTTAVCKNL